MFDFMVAVGLPVTFEELGLAGISREQLLELEAGFAGPGSIAHNHVFTVTPFDIYSAIYLMGIDNGAETQPTAIGKPEPAMFELAMAQMGAKPRSTATLGDRIDTDMLGGASIRRFW